MATMKVKEGYVNPLTMMGQKKNGLTQMQQNWKQRSRDPVQELTLKQQTLQNQMLLLKSTTNGMGTEQTQKVIEKQLEEVNTQLTSAKAEAVEAPPAQEQATSSVRRNMDVYEKEEGKPASPGLYQLEKEEEEGYRVNFTPFAESASGT